LLIRQCKTGTNLLSPTVFAMAPLGIVTALVSAIRVGGPRWLKALVGRARENLAAVEVEVMSSTSHEVCELWNGEAIVRAMGRPKVKQLIYVDEERDTPTMLGVTTLEKPEHYLEKNGPCNHHTRLMDASM
jgi:hypothetical protein